MTGLYYFLFSLLAGSVFAQSGIVVSNLDLGSTGENVVFMNMFELT